MILKEKEYDGKKFRNGGKVKANDKSMYEGLYGIVSEIRTDGDKYTENPDDDIFVDFEIPEDINLCNKIEKRFNTPLYDISLDHVIMAPSMLIEVCEEEHNMTFMGGSENKDNLTKTLLITSFFVENNRGKLLETINVWSYGDLIEKLKDLFIRYEKCGYIPSAISNENITPWEFINMIKDSAEKYLRDGKNGYNYAYILDNKQIIIYVQSLILLKNWKNVNSDIKINRLPEEE